MTPRDNAQKAISYSYKLLAIRPRSEKELRERLQKRFGQTEVSSAVLSLKDKGLINDAKFARQWIDARMNTNPKAKRLLWRELRQKGVPVPVIEEVLSEKTGDEKPIAKNLAEDRLAKLKNLPKEEKKRKLFGFLRQRGFDYGVIEEAVEEVLGESVK